MLINDVRTLTASSELQLQFKKFLVTYESFSYTLNQ